MRFGAIPRSDSTEAFAGPSVAADAISVRLRKSRRSVWASVLTQLILDACRARARLALGAHTGGSTAGRLRRR
jgi:hypothetical protein